ncbi:hypothetical protein EMIT0P2_30656 [Pseudomonas sp. IT-P2]
MNRDSKCLMALEFLNLHNLRNELSRCERRPDNPLEPWAASRTSADGGRQRRNAHGNAHRDRH